LAKQVFNSDILIVDDQDASLQLLFELLDKKGYQIRWAESPQIALETATQKPPGLILLDVNMPGMDCFEFCMRLQKDKRTQQVPVIFISSENDLDSRVRGFEVGGVDCILKPFQEQEVLARVKTHMQMGEMKQNLEKLADKSPTELTKSIASLEKEIKTLKESEGRLRLVFENSYDTIVIAQDEVVKYCNSRITELSGYSIAEIYSMKFSELIHPDDKETVGSEYKARLSGYKAKNSYSVRIITKDEKEKHVLVSSALVTWNNEPATLAIITDITRLKEAEAKLIRSEERFRQLMEQSPLAMEILSPDGRIMVINSAWKTLWGVNDTEAAETIDKYNMLTDPQLEKLGVMDEVKEAFKGKHIVLPPIKYDTGQTKEDFDIMILEELISPWIQSQLYPVLDSEGNIAFIVNTYLDITELKNAGEMVRKSKDDFQILMEASPLGIAIYKPDGKIDQVNTAFKKLWDLSDEEMAVVIANYNYFTDKQIKSLGLSPMVERAFKGESIIMPPIDYEGNRTIKDLGLENIEAQTRTIQTHLHSVKDAKGEVEFVVIINKDLTDIKQAERDAQQQRESLARLDRASSMGQLTGSIAHELNQPLTGILSNAQAAQLMINKDKWDKQELNEILTDIVNDTKRAGSVIHNLRELYREQKIEFNPLDVCMLVEDTLQLLRSELIIQDTKINIDCPPSLPVVNGTEVMIQQVLVNLIQNGIQAMEKIEKDERVIRIDVVQDGSFVNIAVTDKGIGIDSDKIDQIFEPMVTWKPGGTGMGLAISNSIIESHGGKMWSRNNKLGGATVGFSIPIPAKTT